MGSYEELLFFGGGSILIASEEPHQSLSTAAYSVILL